MPKPDFKEEARAWFQSLKFSTLSLVLLGIVAMAAVILTPNISVFVQQQRELQDLRESVELHRQAVNEAEAAKLKWQDPVYIRAQARERLYYVMPGETQLTVLNDGITIPVDAKYAVSETIAPMERNWTLDFARSVVQAGITTANPQDFK